MNFDPKEVTERFRLAGEDWSDLDAAANLLEESRRSVRAELFIKAIGTMAEKEAYSLHDPIYREHCEKMVEARRKANRARVNYDAAKVWIDLVRSVEATRRREIGAG